MNSTHKCEVVPVVLKQHPNADSLSIVEVFGYQVCVKTESWQGIALGAYVVPDSLVDVSRPEFAFLSEMSDNKGKTHVRIRAKKLRGVVSYGMLIPAPVDTKEGDDVSALLGVERYNPVIPTDRTGYVSTKATPVPPPDIGYTPPTYDIDAFQRYAKEVFKVGELVYVSEKIDGANARFVFDGERMHIGSRNRWLEPVGESLWHRALERRPEIEQLCRAHPNCVLWGEVAGWVQDLRYNMTRGEVDFVAFDIMTGGRWMDVIDMTEACERFGVPLAPCLGVIPYNFDKLMEMSDGPSVYANGAHYREGVVVKSMIERGDNKTGRAQLKIVSISYFENQGKEKPYKK